jgi:FkbM family methyltransferase
MSRSRAAVHLAALVSNQCRCVLSYGMTNGTDIRIDGEAMLIELLAPHVHRFVDVGANVGKWTALMLAQAPPDVRGLLFDAGKAAAQRLRERFTEDPRVKIVEIGLSSAPGEASFYEVEDAGGQSSLNQGIAISNPTKRTVKLSTLDIECPVWDFNPIDMLKIDTEGHDLHVLWGAKNLLERRAIKVIQFEYHQLWSRAGSTLRAAADYLAQFDYQLFLLKPEGLYTLDLDRFGEYFACSNFVAVQPAMMPLLHSRIRGEF